MGKQDFLIKLLGKVNGPTYLTCLDIKHATYTFMLLHPAHICLACIFIHLAYICLFSPVCYISSIFHLLTRGLHLQREDLEENDQHIDGVQHTNGVERIDGAEHTNGVEHIDAVASPDNVSASTQPGEIEASTQDKSTKCCLKNGFLSTLQLSLKS